MVTEMEGATPTPGDGFDAGRRVGLLPVWAWAALVVAVCVAFARVRNARLASTSAATDDDVSRAELVALVRRNTVAMEALTRVLLARQATETATAPSAGAGA